MKKFILSSAVLLCMLLQTKAQQEKQKIGSAKYAMQKTNVFPQHKLSILLTNTTGHNGPGKDYDYYMHKKKNNLTAGSITLGAGLLLSGIGWAVASNSNSFDDDQTAAILLIAGAASGIASIPLMVMSFVYGHKAKVELTNQKTGFGIPSKVSKNITGITLSMPIGK